jgi:hypothetical protein
VTTAVSGAAPRDCGVTYTLQPLGRGPAHLDAVKSCETHVDALDQAAAQIYQHIAKSLPDVFPTWVRWRTPEALNVYLAGCEWRTGGDLDDAAWRLEEAISASPFNALAALQLANLNERRAGVASSRWAKAYFQARALARYLDTARTWPSVVEARYRTSVVSSALATSYDALTDPNEVNAIRAIVPLFSPSVGGVAPANEYANRLRNLADLESRATVQLLNPFYVIVRQRRPRNQFESKGRDRRALRNVVRVSRHCVRTRRLNDMNKSDRGALEARSRAVAVLLLSWRNLSWQARYNVACFEALRLAGHYVAEDATAGVEARALRNLDRAIRESAGELTRAWIESDPDMAYFQE